jgi:hypothetical protein
VGRCTTRVTSSMMVRTTFRSAIEPWTTSSRLRASRTHRWHSARTSSRHVPRQTEGAQPAGGRPCRSHQRPRSSSLLACGFSLRSGGRRARPLVPAALPRQESTGFELSLWSARCWMRRERPSRPIRCEASRSILPRDWSGEDQQDPFSRAGRWRGAATASLAPAPKAALPRSCLRR